LSKRSVDPVFNEKKAGKLESRNSGEMRKLIRKKVLSVSNATEYKAIIEKLGLKLNAFIKSIKA
jgi:hypothetical protein